MPIMACNTAKNIKIKRNNEAIEKILNVSDIYSEVIENNNAIF